jgi:hypothetical protein
VAYWKILKPSLPSNDDSKRDLPLIEAEELLVIL